MRSISLVMVLFLAACAPTLPTAAAKSDTAMASELRSSIVTVYGDSQPSWYAYLGAPPDVAVRDGVGIIATSLAAADEALAATICRAIAAVVFDANGDPIGVSDILVIAGGQQLATCDTGT